MSSLAARIKEARTRSTSVGPRAVLVPSNFLGASLVAVAATDGYQPRVHTATASAAPATVMATDLPLADLRGIEQELAGLEADVAEPSPMPRVPIYEKPRRAKTAYEKPRRAKTATKKISEPIVRVKKMTEPIVRMKNGNETHRTTQPVVQVVVKRKTAPALDAPEKALAWLQGMVKNVNVSAIPTMLDYYRRLGWIPNEAYGWLVELSTGLTKSAQPATWRMVKNDPAQLAHIHRESYKHLKGLFGERMNRSV